MSAFLLDTLIWTAVLIVMVLIVRRPVTRWLGAPTAYALWALPMLRLILPPLHLPAWLGPADPQSGLVAADTLDPMIARAMVDPELSRALAPMEPIAPTAPVPASDWLSQMATLPLAQIVFGVWAAGFAGFLFFRFSAYLRLRSDLLERAREVGCAPPSLRILPPIRLIETPGTAAPLAFGVIDPVIALPPGFMAQPDRMSRDLALAHELAHHRGHDLLINVLMQPLFALHWFNPLSRYGWLALRRDQEAACDTRVIAARPRAERAQYAKVIASFAAGPNVALAASMACPVLGDKSIVQRLRNLKMTQLDTPSPSRRLAARALLFGGTLALPLTASITYAERAAPEPPAAPAAPASAVDTAPQAPEPPVPPQPTELPAPPAPPTPPAPNEAPSVLRNVIVKVDTDTGQTVETIVTTRRFVKVTPEDDQSLNIDNRAFFTMSEQKRKEWLAERHAELREGFPDTDRMFADLPRVSVLALDEDTKAGTDLPRMIVRRECQPGSDKATATTTDKDGNLIVTICQSRFEGSVWMEKARTSSARRGLEQARDEMPGTKPSQRTLASKCSSTWTGKLPV